MGKKKKEKKETKINEKGKAEEEQGGIRMSERTDF